MCDNLRCTASLADPSSTRTRLDLDLLTIWIPCFSVGYYGLNNYNTILYIVYIHWHYYDNATASTFSKKEAIDLSKPFLWFDDDLFPDERAVLREHGLLDNWIEVALHKDQSHLQRFVTSLSIPMQSLD